MNVNLKGYAKERLFKKMLRSMKVEQVFRSKLAYSPFAFGIVHWNAPAFLLLNIEQLSRLHPECTILVFDNNSTPENYGVIYRELQSYPNVTLFSSRKDYENTWACHVLGLQYLLNYAAHNGVVDLLFLDQDCLLTRRVDGLVKRFSSGVLLIGARDYVAPKHDYGGVLKNRVFRRYFNRVHASFMLLQPQIINYLFGECSLMDGFEFEPYHGLSRKLGGAVLFLETEMHKDIPMLTAYKLDNTVYAYHSWYSSRALSMTDNECLNGLPVAWIKASVDKSLAFMEKLLQQQP